MQIEDEFVEGSRRAVEALALRDSRWRRRGRWEAWAHAVGVQPFGEVV
jgi:hypothetical protein